ncbi:MAG: zinc ribbon domain-containing protein [bacterium]|nr:zinc ribbon domain-containing protein [bacterium]
MPLYEYRCRSCGADFEHLTTSISQQHSVHCPRCGGKEVQKQISASSSLRSTAQQAGAPSCRPRGAFR